MRKPDDGPELDLEQLASLLMGALAVVLPPDRSFILMIGQPGSKATVVTTNLHRSEVLPVLQSLVVSLDPSRN